MVRNMPAIKLEGFRLEAGYLDRSQQESIVDWLKSHLANAPFFTPRMPRSAKPMSVRMTSLGEFGWYASPSGYQYINRHPGTARPFPAIPDMLLDIWTDITKGEPLPDSCLVNYYDAHARMGLHADLDEDDRQAPVLSLSLGDTAIFRLGGLSRRDPTRSLKLHSGDVMVLEGPLRDAYHGVDRILFGSSTLLSQGGRLNLTLRRVRKP